MCHFVCHETPRAILNSRVKPVTGRVTPDRSGEDPFLGADSLLSKGESTYRFDCNTVGPVPVASGYGSRTLTQSAAHALFSSEENASSLRGEARLSKVRGTPVVESRDRGTKMTSFTGSTTSVLPQTKNSSVKITCFTII